MVDGAGVLRQFFQVILPLCRPALAALATLEFTWIYNDFFWAVVLVNQGDDRPITSSIPNLDGPVLLGRQPRRRRIDAGRAADPDRVPAAAEAVHQRSHPRCQQGLERRLCAPRPPGRTRWRASSSTSHSGVPAILYWGSPLAEDTDLDALAAAMARPIPIGTLDVEPPITLVPLHGDGFAGRPGLVGRASRGRAWAPRFAGGRHRVLGTRAEAASPVKRSRHGSRSSPTMRRPGCSCAPCSDSHPAVRSSSAPN